MESTLSTVPKQSKSSRKDFNRKCKLQDKSNYLVLYMSRDMVANHEVMRVFTQSNGTYVSCGDKPVSIVDHDRSLLYYNKLKAEVIVKLSREGYTRFCKLDMSEREINALLNPDQDYWSYYRDTGKIAPAFLVRKMWGKEMVPRPVKIWDEDYEAYIVAWVVFDPHHDFSTDWM